MRDLFFLLVLSLLLPVGCRNGSRRQGSEIKVTRVSGDEGMHEPVPISINCRLRNNVSYDLHAKIDRRGFDLLVHTLVTKSYVGFWSGSQINQGKNYAEKIALRAHEIGALSECLVSQNKVGDAGLLIPTNVAAPVVSVHEMQGQVSPATIDARSDFTEQRLLNQFAQLESAVASQDWRATYHGIGQLRLDLVTAARNSLLVSKKLDEIGKRTESIHAKLVRGGVLMCPGQVQLIEDPRQISEFEAKLLRNLASQSCFVGRSATPQESLRFWVAATDLLMPGAITSVYYAALNAKTGDDLRRVFVAALASQRTSGGLKSWSDDITKLRQSSDGSREVLQAFIKGKLLTAYPDFFALNSELQDQMPAVLVDYL
ncbi:MAG: hypothetical protein FJ146_08725 [Deltaproteobacteria bacterium]|nr:hypothetical protein [Deltaproteobacteria bacterium]